MNGKNLKYFVMGATVVAVGLGALAVTIPNTFSSGEVVSASKLNDNFTALNNGKQERVSGTCAVGSSIRAVAADGTVTCQTDGLEFGSTVTGSDITRTGLRVNHSTGTAGTAIFGNGGIGVIGRTSGTTSDNVGVYAFTTNPSAVALRADATTTGVAAELNGEVKVDGRITKKFSAGSFIFSQATPIAYGSVDISGTLVGGTPNVTVTRPFDGIYNIVIAGETYAFGTHMVTATAFSPSSSLRTASVRDGGTGGGFRVLTFDSAANQANSAFHFVVYKP